MRKSLLAAALLAGASLSACTSTINSDVARFHRLSAPSGETFRIVPADSAKNGSLEFDTYARQVSDQLTRVGFRPAGDAAPTLEVKLDYGISGGKEKIATRNYGSSFRGGFGYASFYRGYGGRFYDPFYDPFFYGAWSEPEVYSYTVYNRNLKMDIVRSNGGEKLFEGRVESIGSDNRLPEVMPYLVQAMFTNFPGNSGVTQQVKIPVRKN